MRLALLAPESSPSWGGVGSYVYNLAKNLSKDIEIHLISVGRDLPDSYVNILNRDGIYIHNILSIKNSNVLSVNVHLQFAMLMKLKELHKQYKFDLIHSHSGHLPHLFSQFQNIAPNIVTVHAETKGLVNIWKPLRNKNKIEKLNTLFSPLVEFCEKISFKKADRLIPVSNFVLNQIIREYRLDIGSKSHVIHNATDINLFVPRNKTMSDIPNITYVGRFYSLKGFDTCVKSLSDLVSSGYKIKSFFVGRGDPEYLRENLELRLPREVYSILGRINYLDMPDIYNNSDIIIVPSLYEACPGVVLEAMSCGKIVVASDIGGIPEIIRDGFNGILFKSGDSTDLTNKLIHIIEGSVDTIKLQQNARKTIEERFDWTDKANEISKEYRKLI